MQTLLKRKVKRAFRGLWELVMCVCLLSLFFLSLLLYTNSFARRVFSSYTHTQTLSLGWRSGLLLPLGGGPSLFPDRYHLGGPTSVRMFRPNSMGPRDHGTPPFFFLSLPSFARSLAKLTPRENENKRITSEVTSIGQPVSPSLLHSLTSPPGH